MLELVVEHEDNRDEPNPQIYKCRLTGIEYDTIEKTSVYSYDSVYRLDGDSWTEDNSFSTYIESKTSSFFEYTEGDDIYNDSWGYTRFISGEFGLSDTQFSDSIYHYTFNVYDGLTTTPVQDYTILCPKYCYNNVITSREGYDGKTTKRYLPYVLFNNTGRNQACYTNIVDAPIIFEKNSDNELIPCYISFGKGAHNNRLEKGCKNIGAGEDFYHNVFGLGCNSIYSANKCQNNTFGIYCKNTQLYNNCVYNEFKNQVGAGVDNVNVSLSPSCTYNHFGNNCRNIDLGSGCSHNRFEDSNMNITLRSTYNNSLKTGPGCDYNYFGTYCRNIDLQDGTFKYYI